MEQRKAGMELKMRGRTDRRKEGKGRKKRKLKTFPGQKNVMEALISYQ